MSFQLNALPLFRVLHKIYHTDDKNIARLDKGEAIISSNFARFAVPIKIPLFEELVTNSVVENLL